MKQLVVRRHHQFAFTIIAAGLLLLSAACSHERTDAQIIGDVVTRIHANPQIANKNIAVMSSNGVVTLNGTAGNDTERAIVANAAAQVEGVKTVINDMVIDGPATLPLPQVAVAAQPVAPPPAVVEHTSKPSSYHRSEGKQASKATSSSAAANSAPPASSTQTSTSNAGVNATTVASTTTAPKSDAVIIPYPPAPVKMVTVDAGTGLSVRLIDSIDSGRNKAGDTFRATLAEPVEVEGQVVIPSGSEVVGRISDVKDSGRFSGRAELAIELTSLRIGNQHYELHTNQFTQQGKSQGTRTAETVGGGAALGAIIGAIAGGGKGAAIGAAAGAGAGGGVQAARGAQQVHLGSEARLHFRLDNSIFVPASPSSNRVRSYDSETNSARNDTNVYQPSSNRDNRDSYPSDRTSSPSSSSDGDRPVLKRRPTGSSDSNDGPN